MATPAARATGEQLEHVDLSFAPVPVAELMQVWVGYRGVGAREAIHALSVQLLVCGYPEDAEAVAAADAIAMTLAVGHP